MKLEKKHWAMLVAGVVVLFLVYWFFFRKKKSESGYDSNILILGDSSYDPAFPEIGGSESGYKTKPTGTIRPGGKESCPCSDSPNAIWSPQCCPKGSSARVTGDNLGWCCSGPFTNGTCEKPNKWIKCGGKVSVAGVSSATGDSGYARTTRGGAGVSPTVQAQVNPCGPGNMFCYMCNQVDAQGNCLNSVLGCCNKTSGKWLGSVAMGFN